MWFYFRQNNSGGFYKSPAIYIFVEADTAEQANEVAASIEGVYFDGVSDGLDCGCCGDRWSRAYPEVEWEGNTDDTDGYDTLEAAISDNYFPSFSDHESAEQEGTTVLKIVFQQEDHGGCYHKWREFPLIGTWACKHCGAEMPAELNYLKEA